MAWKYQQILNTLSKNKGLLKGSLHGLERECLRVTSNGDISMKPHPKELGSSLFHPLVTTDFAESQMELVTPPCKSEKEALEFMEKTYIYISEHLKSEVLWPFNMPCRLPKDSKIPLAKFGTSHIGKLKTLYRLGLSKRYGGAKMQTVSGTHYNFSFSKKFWKTLHKKFAPKQDLQDFINESYLKLIRNFLRYSWLNTYLFGASPAVDKSYIRKKHRSLKRHGWKTYYGPHATSLRLSEIGYYSKVQAQLAVSFNSIESYVQDLTYAISTKSPRYKGLPGLNENILQIENEHYSRIRPKQRPIEGQTALESIQSQGIRYVEARAVDIDPYCAIGLCSQQIYFLHTFLIYCLVKESPPINKEQERTLTANQNKVALYGRKPNLTLLNRGRDVSMQDWSHKLIEDMRPIAKLLGAKYEDNLNRQLAKIDDPSLTPSAQKLRDMISHKESFVDFGLRLSKAHKKYLSSQTLSKKDLEYFDAITAKSLKDQRNLEIRDEALLKGYEDMEVSTQILIREAQKQKIKVEIIDSNDNFIKLTKGSHSEYIKQATKTRLDSYISFLLMENKQASKHVLIEQNIQVPPGANFHSMQEALESYHLFAKQKIVVKPTSTNFGIGISFVSPGQKQKYEQALKEAFSHGKAVIVEEFITGPEYRLLVMGNKVVSVLHRLPANVVGDGKNSISQLIKLKNEDSSNYKFFNDYYIRTGKIERDHLASQKLTFKSIPKKGKRIFLRTNSNVSTGGDPIDMTDEIHESYNKIAVQAAKAADAKLCGVDMIIKNLHKPANSKNYSIIEINFNPALQMHEFPVVGKGVNTAKPLLKLLGF
ncbi:glutamate--cysteine ligase [Candidatus Gracilibacteria bacterium]|nr:glutamate--cysteine ligase [Candidatus Gracilibacteria bacterium]